MATTSERSLPAIFGACEEFPAVILFYFVKKRNVIQSARTLA